MITVQFLAEWALRSSILILCGALLLRALRVKDPAIRLAAWTVVLFGSLAIPALSVMLPKVPLAMVRLTTPGATPLPVEGPVVHDAPVTSMRYPLSRQTDGIPRFDRARALLAIYLLVALALLLRLCVGLAIGLSMLRRSAPTGQTTDGIEIRESDRMTAPVTLGIVHPVIVLPGDWRQWNSAKLDAVLAHERSHIRRYDPAVQLLSAIHRALLWHSPLSWFLHKRIVRVAEEASDDAAVAVIRDRAVYAEVLLDFIRRGVAGASGRSANWLGVPMARYGRPDERIHRILDGTTLSRGVTRWSVAAILAMASPLAYVVAAAHPQSTPERSAPQAQAAPTEKPPAFKAPPVAPQILAQPAPAAKPEPVPVYLNGLGYVAAYTVTVKTRVDGQLMSVSFQEGDLVQAGQVLASIDSRLYQVQLAQMEAQLARDQAQLADIMRAQSETPKQQLAQLEGSIRTDQANIEHAKLQLNYAQVIAPITGVTGLRLVDPGNIVRAADATGIVVINQLQPIAVVFSIPEDRLRQVRARLKDGASLPVEAWNRDNSEKIATGRLAAVDNQIDTTTGTVKLKAVFDNKDDALFPNEFVNVRLLVNTR